VTARAATPAESTVELVSLMGVADGSRFGSVHGGIVLMLCDEAAGLAGTKHASSRTVTAGLDRVVFMTPVYVGDILTVKATVNAVWRTSMEVGVRVEAHDPLGGEVRHTNSAFFTVVSVDSDGRPQAVDPLQCGTEEERRRESQAQLRRRNRLAERDELVRADA
jgi:acyl-CoA hydrolase